MTITQQRVTCGKCKQVSDVEVVMNAPVSVVAASMEAARCPKCGSDKLGLGGGYSDAPGPGSPIEARISWWKRRGEVGISSETIYGAFTGQYPRDQSYPFDPDDFRRCKQLLDLIPEWRERLGEVSGVIPWFAPFVDRWADMEQLYALESPKGICPKLYALMKVAEKEAYAIRCRK